MRSATHLETFLIKQSMLFLHVSNVSGMRRGMCMRSHASYAEAWCIEYCCHVWAGAPSCYLELLDKLQKRMWRIVGPSLVASLEPLANHRYVASLSLFYRYYFGRCLSLFYRYYFGRCLSLFCRYYCGRCSSELAQLVPLPFSRGGLLVILIDCMIFLSPFLDVTRMSMSAVSFLAELHPGIVGL